MINLKRTLTLLTLLLFVSILTACGEAEELYGKIIKITGQNITIETGTFQKTEEDPEGFVSDGSFASYSLSNNIDTEHLSENMVVKLTLQNDTVTAIEAETDEPGSSAEASDSQQSSDTANLCAVLTVDGKEQTLSNREYDSSKADIGTILLKNKASLTLDGCTLTKSGNSSGKEEKDFLGLNAIFTASEQSTASLQASTLTSSGTGANAIFSTGEDTKVTASDFKIYTTGDFSHGLFSVFSGSISASGGDITTKGDYCSPIFAGRDQGSIQVRDTTVSAEGSNSPCIYSSGTLNASKISGSATGSPIAIVTKGSSTVLKDCLLQGAGKAGIALFNTESEGTQEGRASLNIADSKLTTTSEGPMVYATNVQGTVTLKNTTLYYSSGILVKAAGNKSGRWGIPGKNGGELTLKGSRQTLTGDILCDSISTVALKLTEKSLFRGTINAKNTAKSISVSLDKSSRWEVTGDSYVSKLTNKDAKCKNIRSSGHTVYYDSDQKGNSWLKGKTISLPGGGKLTPAP